MLWRSWGFRARQAVGVPDHGIDLVIEPGGTRVQVKRRALVTDEVAGRLLAEMPRSPRLGAAGGG